VDHPSTVLLVDDDEDIRHVLRLLFELEDFDVVAEAGNGADAVRLALKHQPEFVILDYLMPGMRGDVTAEALRGVVPEAQIVAFSAVLESKPEWADSFLNKERISEIIPVLRALIPTAQHGLDGRA